MPFNTTAAAHVLGVRPHLAAGTRICHLCDHELEVADHFLRWLMQNRERYPFADSAILEEILARGRESRKAMVPRYYEAIGFGPMEVLGSHSRLGGRVVDFNRNLATDFNYRETFDFVDNTGVTEHIFDQRAAFENIHNLCKVGGIMLHRIPMSGVLNITFYCVTPLFLQDIAHANRYEIVDIRIGNRWGDTIRARLANREDAGEPDYRSAIPNFPGFAAGVAGEGPQAKVWIPEAKLAEAMRLPAYLEVAEMMEKTSLGSATTALGRSCHALTARARQFRPENPGELYAMVLYRKTSEEPFRVPFQSTSIFDIETGEMRKRYAHQFEEMGIPIES